MVTPARVQRPILVLGAHGQVGAELVPALAPLGEVVALGRAQADLAQVGTLTELVGRIAPSVVVNAAAYTGVDLAEKEPALAARVNAEAPGALAAACAELGIPFVHYSTDYVFDGAASTPYVETSPTAPLGVYGRTKRDGEMAVREANASHLLLRTSWVYGARGKNFLRTILHLAHTRETLRIITDQRGAPTWSRDVAAATARILAQSVTEDGRIALDAERSGTFHLTAAGETTWFDFARAIIARDPDRERQTCREVEPTTTAEYAAPAPRPAYSVLCNDLVERVHGVRLPHWESSLARVISEVAAP